MAVPSKDHDRGSFDQRVYDVVALIPTGRLATYGQVADWIGAYGCARQVGWALSVYHCPRPSPGTAW